MAKSRLDIIKSSGAQVAYDQEKLRKSLTYSGASDAIIGSILKRIDALLYPSMSTQELYDLAYEMLMEHSSFYGARYKIKKALFELGPSGFPFEKYINQLLIREGVSSQLNQYVEGKCITHEVDIIGKRASELFVVECKFHSDRTRVCNVKVPLYIHSRYRDVHDTLVQEYEIPPSNFIGWIITNTRFTKDAIDYARCAAIRLMSWNYPLDYSLKLLVDQHQLYPITALSSLSQFEKQQLLKQDLVLCSELSKDIGILEKIGVSKSRIDQVIEECRFVCYLSKNGTKN